ncbi:MAG: YceH family protein [Holophagae bacterium]|jgi:uncharacterized protein YceH (UPF0502 family)
MRLPRELDGAEVRVLGCLLEKQRTTPDAYPLTVNALTAACNQKSNRHPVMQMTPDDVESTLSRLRSEVMVWPEEGARATRWSHTLDRKWGVSDGAMAVVAALMLRGPQTSGELRARTERMASFDSISAIETTLIELSEGDEPLVAQLERQPGQKEARWMHLLAGEPTDTVDVPSVSAETGLAARIAELDERVARLERRLGLDDGGL